MSTAVNTPAGGDPVLSVSDLTKTFTWRRPSGRRMERHAVKGVSFDVLPGETFCLVGESGCGKSTTGRAIMQLVRPDSGSVRYHGTELVGLRGSALRDARRGIQMVFQDPYSSLNPRRRIGAILEEAIAIHEKVPAQARTDRVVDILGQVGFGEEYYYRFPHEMSGGQRQRIGVARALMVDPDLIICDEPVSALDVSIQSQVLNMLRDLQRRLGLSYLFISHDMSVVRHVGDRVAVMTGGEIVEQGTNEQVFGDPQHPYTKKLLAAVPAAHPRLARERRRARTEGAPA